jgi:hypothetical protein
MRNNSEGRELPPLPYPQIPGLEVSEPATPYQQLVAHLDFMAAVRQVPSRPVSSPEAVLGTEIHEQVAELLRPPVVQMDAAQLEARVAAWRELHPLIAAHWRAASTSPSGRQRGCGAWTVLCAMAVLVLMFIGLDLLDAREQRRLTQEIVDCSRAGGVPAVHDNGVECKPGRRSVTL